MSTNALDETICDLCDMPLYGCEHGRTAVVDAAPPTPLTVPFRTVPWAAYFDSDSYRSEWQTEHGAGRLAVIECGDEHERGDRTLCRKCSAELTACLADVRPLLTDLGIAQTRETAFVEHGIATGEPADDTDESPLPYNPAASDAILRIGRALAADEPRNVAHIAAAAAQIAERLDDLLRLDDAPRIAHAVSGAVLHAFRVVDRPPDPWYFGACPVCERDIYDERGVAVVSCSHCDYRAPRDEHQRACIDAGDDRMLTVSELVGAITKAGEAVTRDQINGYIRREGLPRERKSRPSWRKGRLTSVDVYVYRLGDVRRLAAEAERRRLMLADAVASAERAERVADVLGTRRRLA